MSDRAFKELLHAFGDPTIPKKIWQKPFEGEPWSKRKLAGATAETRSYIDATDYALDLIYVRPLQKDLLAYLFPRCLETWRRVVVERIDSTFVEHFHHALATTDILDNELTAEQSAAARRFIEDALLGVLAADSTPGEASARRLQTFASFGTFSGVESLWRSWWSMKTPGHAVAALQYASALVYVDGDANDGSVWSFPPWEYESIGFGERWREENVLFLERTLTVDYLQQKLSDAATALGGAPACDMSRTVYNRFLSRREGVRRRLPRMMQLLRTPNAPGIRDWD